MPVYAFMESAIPALPPAARFTATSIPCPACEARAEEPCSGPRICSERLGEALELMRRGELAPAPESTPVGLADDSPDGCTACTTFNLRTLGCDEHRCAAMVQGRGGCRTARTAGSRYCYIHRCVVGEHGERCTWKAINNRKCADHAGR
jgi:hypothetical protein